jgi:16S rRNA (adenine1518-N6/adenine1519-N6)-dimethyltransferase
MFHLLAQAEIIRDMHFMLQTELVNRMSAAPGGRAYGRLSVMVQYRCRVESLFHVPPAAFHPAPKVDSSVVRLMPYSEPPLTARDEQRFSRIVRQAFSKRRKTLRNALKGLVSEMEITMAGIDPGIRPEQCSVADFVNLSNTTEPAPP